MMDEHVKAYYAEQVARELNPPKLDPKPAGATFGHMKVDWGLKIANPNDFGVIYTNCI